MADEKVVSEAEELPKAIVRRVIKEKLSQNNNSSDISVFKEALNAFSESARIFIHYLSATANDICKDSKRQTINADDVFKALEEIEFSEFIGPLKASLEVQVGSQRFVSLITKKVMFGDQFCNPLYIIPCSESLESPPFFLSLLEFKRKNAGKKTASKAKETNKKQKLETPVEKGDEEVEVEVDDDNVNDVDDDTANGDVDDDITNGDVDDDIIIRDVDDSNKNGDVDETPEDGQ